MMMIVSIQSICNSRRLIETIRPSEKLGEFRNNIIQDFSASLSLRLAPFPLLIQFPFYVFVPLGAIHLFEVEELVSLLFHLVLVRN